MNYTHYSEEEVDCIFESNQERLMNEGIEAAMLDDLVHEVASSLATEVNNEGIKSQLGFLRSNHISIDLIIKRCS